MIARYGFSVVIYVFFITVSIIVFALFLKVVVLRELIIFIAFLFFGFTLYFFRDPERRVPDEVDIVVSPADGKVILIRRFFESEFLFSDAIQISIFMSPLDVHVNRIPVSGEVKFLKYVPGKYLVAFDEKSSESNERMLIGIESDDLKVIVKQIAGFIARRIVCVLKVGDKVRIGERFGMIRFGSRVDVILPMDKVDIRVKHGDIVRAGETIIAKIKV